jgi:hypothetical protein
MFNLVRGSTHQLYSRLLRACHVPPADERDARDRGALSLEQVLWFVAVSVSVVVIAAILWNKIRDEADQVNLDDNLPTPPDQNG